MLVNFHNDTSPGPSSPEPATTRLPALLDPLKSQIQTLLSFPPLARAAAPGPPSPLHFKHHTSCRCPAHRLNGLISAFLTSL